MPQFIVNYKSGEKDNARPWGGWEIVSVGHLDAAALAYCNKIITVKPGAQLSIQKHEFRQEDWKIESGEAIAYLGDSPEHLKPCGLKPDDCIHIPLGAWHRIRNPGKTPLVFSERQSGIYLDEKDILRHPTPTDPRTTDEAAMQRIRAEVARLGLIWPQ